MKKKIVILLLALISVNLFAKEVKVQNNNVVKEFDSKVFPVHFKITKDNNGQAILFITDDSIDKLEARIYTDNVNDAFDWYFDIEANLLDSFIEGRKDEVLMNLIKENPLFFMIVAFYDDDYEWVQDTKTGEYFYMVDCRTFIPETDDTKVENNKDNRVYSKKSY